MKGPWTRIADIRAANKAIGHFFFDNAVSPTFSFRVVRAVYGGRYFIVKETRLAYVSGEECFNK